MTPLSTGSAAEQARYHPHAAGLAHCEGESASERGSIFLPSSPTSGKPSARRAVISRTHERSGSKKTLTPLSALLLPVSESRRDPPGLPLHPVGEDSRSVPGLEDETQGNVQGVPRDGEGLPQAGMEPHMHEGLRGPEPGPVRVHVEVTAQDGQGLGEGIDPRPRVSEAAPGPPRGAEHLIHHGEGPSKLAPLGPASLFRPAEPLQELTLPGLCSPPAVVGRVLRGEPTPEARGGVLHPPRGRCSTGSLR